MFCLFTLSSHDKTEWILMVSATYKVLWKCSILLLCLITVITGNGLINLFSFKKASQHLSGSLTELLSLSLPVWKPLELLYSISADKQPITRPFSLFIFLWCGRQQLLASFPLIPQNTAVNSTRNQSLTFICEDSSLGWHVSYGGFSEKHFTTFLPQWLQRQGSCLYFMY